MQDTGNPVLDSVVNILGAVAWTPGSDMPPKIAAVHAAILEIAEEEPGGLRARSKDGRLFLVKDYQNTTSDDSH